MSCHRRTIALALALAALSLGAAPLLASPASQWVADNHGQSQRVPLPPSHIADLWFAHNELLVMLGAAGRIQMTVDQPATTPWMFKLAPMLKQATPVRATANPEALLAAGIDLVFVASPTAAAPYRRLGLPTLAMDFQDPAGLLRAIDITAQVIHTDTARQRAAQYRQELQQLMQQLQKTLAAVPEQARPRVLHLESLSPLRIDGGNTLIEQWIRLAGGRNVAAAIKGSKRPVDFEQILAWQPDLIIIGAHAGDLAQLQKQAWWHSLKAVQQGRVYVNPLGIFPWDRYGSEFLLQLQWAAKILQPQHFQALDLQAAMRRFYRDYFQFPINDADIERMLHGQPPDHL